MRRLIAREIDSYQMEKRYLRKDGGLLWAQLGVSLVQDAAGHPRYLVAQVQDISAQKAAQEALQEAHAELARVIGAVTDCLYSAEMLPDGIFTYRYFSPVAERLLGRPASDFFDNPQNWLDIVHPDDLPTIQRAIDQIRHNQAREVVTEVRVFLPDGSLRWVQDKVLVTSHGPDHFWLDGVLTDITERKAFESVLSHRAMHDALTGLPNRPLFLDRLNHALERRKARGELVAVLFLDLDNFKTVNDGLGHEAGDELLRAIARRLHQEIRVEDTLARFGGDEFAILLETLESAEQAAAIADRIGVAISVPIVLQNRELYMTASVGIALAGVGDTDPGVVLRNADAALYRAKASGRNRSVVFDPNMTLEALARLELEADLRRVLETGSGLLLHYQPVFDIVRGRLVGCEALVRWIYPHGGLIGPDVFVPLAEETGLIVPLGEWVLVEACRQLREWHDRAGSRALSVSVNLSPRHFRDPSLVGFVERQLAAHALRPEHLVLEVTEGVLVDEQARATLARLKAAGVGLAIDDFGTGYSSLHYLGAIEADGLKIDRRFVSGLAANGREAAIVRAVLALGESLGMRVTAEGVETVAQLEALRRLGCRYVQGFLLGRPFAADAFWTLFLDDGARLPSLETSPAALAFDEQHPAPGAEIVPVA